MRRVGVFGGTFDPPHLGHVATALEIKHLLDLDEVLIVVAGDPWQKTGSTDITPADVRLSLAERAFGGLDGISVSDVEVNRPGASYMVDTLQDLNLSGERSLHLVVGSDAAAGLDTWHDPEQLKRLAKLIVVTRAGHEGRVPPDGWDYDVVDVPAFDISSTEIRRRIASGEPYEGLVPRSVAAEIKSLPLYQDDR